MNTNTHTCLVLGSMPMDIIQRKNAGWSVVPVQHSRRP